jgi:hypothetical protein
MWAGGIYCYESSNITLNNTILWADTAMYASEVLVGNSGTFAASLRVTYSDIQDPNENVICESGCTINWGQGNMDVDPCFGKLGDLNTTKTRTGGDYHLRRGSPCIDTGDPAFAAGAGETDIDGDPRISGKRVDVGADEYKVAITATVELKPETLNLASSGKWITCTIALPGIYDVGDIDAATVLLDGQIAPAWSKPDRLAQKFLLKFDRSQTQKVLTNAKSPASLTVSGTLKDGTDFEGTDTIRLLPARR